MAIIGFNGQINFNVHDIGYDNDQFCSVIKDSGAQAVRVPGGTIANSFLPFDPASRPQPEHIANLYAKTGVDIFIVLNMITQTFDEQLAWLRKLSYLGVPIKYIEFGNEFPNQEFNTKYTSGDEFAHDCRNWITGIHQAFPNLQIEFGVPGGVTDNWNKKMLAIDNSIFLIWHYSADEQYVTADGVVDQQKVRDLIQRDKRSRFPGISSSRLWVTEANIQVKTKDGGEQTVFFKDDIQHGIAASEMMAKFVKMGCPVVLYHNIVGAVSGGNYNGAIISEASGSYLSPTGSAIKQFIAGQV